MKWACAVFFAADAAIAGWLGFRLWSDHQNALKPDELAVPANHEMTGQELESWRTQTLGEADRMVSLHSEPVVQNGSVRIMLSNREECQYAVSLKLLHLETGNTIAQTALVDPGWRVEELPMTFELETGTHHCLACLSYFHPENGALLGETARQVLLNVTD